MNSFLTEFVSKSDSTLLTPQELTDAIIGRVVANGISIVGLIFNLITNYYVRTSTTILKKMIVSLCLMDLLFNVVTTLSIFKMQYPILCGFLGFFVFYGYGGSIAWTCCFAHCLYSTIGQKQSEVDSNEDQWTRYKYVGFISPLVISVAATAAQYYTVNSEYCWHNSNIGDIDWLDMFLSIIPTILAVTYCFYCYASVIGKLRQMGMRIYVELLFYPLILIICFFPWNIYSIYAIVVKESPPYKLYLISNIMLSLQGFLNALVYGLSRTMIKGYKKFCCKKKKKQTEPSLLRPDSKGLFMASELGPSILEDLSISK